MQQSSNTQPPLTPPAATRDFLSFAWPQGQSAQSKRDVSGSPSLDFDAGINTSNAWTVYLDSDSYRSRSLSDGEVEGENNNFEEEIDGRGARVLFAFTGKAEFREVSAKAGDEITIIREQAGDGWSLVKTRQGLVGLLPQSYYTFTVDFISAPGTDPTLHARHLSTSRRDASTTSLTPRGSLASPSSPTPSTKPITIQTTGERMMAAFPSFRQGLLGGKSLNRFSSFVTSGAEAYVLNGAASTPKLDDPPPSIKHIFEASDDEDESAPRANAGPAIATDTTHPSEAEKHFVDAGPSWRQKVPPFRVLVHSPSRRTSILSGAYTVYSVSSLFHLPASGASDAESADSVNSSPSTSRITVHRRFSHFVVLHTALTRRLPGICLPPLPEKQYAGRFNDDFVEARRGDLERYLGRIVRHPVARYAEILTFFLSCESEQEWKRQLPHYLGFPPAGASFYANVFHPDFNFDAEEATEAVDRFDIHIKAVDTGVQGLRHVFAQTRQARVEMSKAERLLSYSLLSLITTKPIATLPNSGVIIREEGAYSPSAKGYVNEQGAWCWREGCEDCLKLTRALQKTSETLQSVADLYDDHARRTQLATHDALKIVAHPSQLYAPIIDTHRNALSRYTEATVASHTICPSQPDEEIASRCETVLNTTMAEMETYHTQKVEDFASLAKEHLDGEIEFYEQVLNRLRVARRTFEPPIYPRLASGSRQPSIYERELECPRLNPDPLPQPCPHVFDSTSMRPVSHAIQEGVGLLLGSATNAITSRGSVFGRFW
ncbi:hypothetical protein B0F90DRAFT_1627635 [Multifurca ochricompacta]|uniref:PX-domain-containing protein n=1 Tax=Multifurca ochricompacta TaxID=376703 RepID=A0AAD4M7J5_9AGAM|nr:hypothetical protein B0F90DRAFT_1627635 [Multifurca ochricompacta]